MTQQHHQNHATWECKYHVVFISKYRKKAIFGVIKKRLGDVFHELARRRESKIEEGHLMPDHVHMLIRGDAGDWLTDHLGSFETEYVRCGGIPRYNNTIQRLADDDVVRRRNDCG